MSKLISYYFKRDKWILLAMVACAVIGSFLLWSNTGEESFVGALSIFVGFTTFLFGISILPLWLCIRDYRRMYGAYGSFYAALPLTGKEVMGGRGIWLIIVEVVAILSSMTFFGPFFIQDMMGETELSEFFKLFLDKPGSTYLASFIVMMVSSMLFATVAWLFVTAVGSEKPFRRFGIGGPIILYIGLQVAMNAVAKVVIDVMGSQADVVEAEFFERALSQLYLRMSLVVGGLMLIAAVVLFLRSVHSHDKKLSVS